MSTVLSIENLSFSDKKRRILNDLSIDLSSFQIVGLLGEENSGKKELLEILSSLRKGYEGKIYVFNNLLGEESLKYISFFDGTTPYHSSMKVKERISLIKSVYGSYYSSSILDNLISNFQIDTSKRLKDLTSRELHRLNLALAISKRSLIYLFDEPLKYFDEKEHDFVLYSINEYCYNPDTLVIISSSDMDEIDSFCTLAVFMKEGKITLVGQPKTLHEIHDASLKGVYQEVSK